MERSKQRIEIFLGITALLVSFSAFKEDLVQQFFPLPYSNMSWIFYLELFLFLSYMVLVLYVGTYFFYQVRKETTRIVESLMFFTDVMLCVILLSPVLVCLYSEYCFGLHVYAKQTTGLLDDWHMYIILIAMIIAVILKVADVVLIEYRKRRNTKIDDYWVSITEIRERAKVMIEDNLFEPSIDQYMDVLDRYLHAILIQDCTEADMDLDGLLNKAFKRCLISQTDFVLITRILKDRNRQYETTAQLSASAKEMMKNIETIIKSTNERLCDAIINKKRAMIIKTRSPMLGRKTFKVSPYVLYSAWNSTRQCSEMRIDVFISNTSSKRGVEKITSIPVSEIRGLTILDNDNDFKLIDEYNSLDAKYVSAQCKIMISTDTISKANRGKE